MRQMMGAILLLMLVVTGCAATQEAKSVEKSGFLGDYSMLKEGERSTFRKGLRIRPCWSTRIPPPIGASIGRFGWTR